MYRMKMSRPQHIWAWCMSFVGLFICMPILSGPNFFEPNWGETQIIFLSSDSSGYTASSYHSYDFSSYFYYVLISLKVQNQPNIATVVKPVWNWSCCFKTQTTNNNNSHSLSDFKGLCVCVCVCVCVGVCECVVLCVCMCVSVFVKSEWK